jgi:hypothetical protein
MLFLACVNYDQDRDASGGSDRVPAFLLVNYAIPVRDDVRTFEDPRRRFKRNTMFSAVVWFDGGTGTTLLFIPRENLQNCST